MMTTFEMSGSGDENWVINIDLEQLAAHLASHPAFIKALSSHIRTYQTKDARRMGNTMGKWAQKQPAPPTTKSRLQ
jgi:uncharacterized protein (DUF305 family)